MIGDMLGYNNVVKNRKLLLERSAKEIMRYSAAKPGFEKAFPTRDSILGNDSESDGSALLKNIFCNVNAPKTIHQIVKESKEIIQENRSSDYFIVYDGAHFETIGYANNETREGSTDPKNAKVTCYTDDIKSYMGYDFVPVSSFNNEGKNSSRIDNPRFAIIKVNNHYAGFSNQKESSYLPFVATLIPSVEMSRCVPHLSITILDDDRNENNLMSLGKFLVGRNNFKNDGFAKGMTKTTLWEKEDGAIDIVDSIFKARSGDNTPHKVAGMELFQSPQSMVNADINKFQSGGDRVLNPFVPLMSIENFNISDNLLNLEFLSTTEGTLSLKLFDRSRLPEIAKLVGQDYLASVFLIIEFGWSHPDGSIISNNPYGQFLDSLKRRELFNISNSKISINDDGTASITLSIVSLGRDSYNKSILSQKYIKREDFYEILRFLEKKIKSVTNDEEAMKTVIKQKSEPVLNINQFDSFDLIDRRALDDIDFFSRVRKILELEKPKVDDLLAEIDSLINDVIEALSVKTDNDDDGLEINLDKDVAATSYETSIESFKNSDSIEEAIKVQLLVDIPVSIIAKTLITQKGFTAAEVTSALIQEGISEEDVQSALKSIGVVDKKLDESIKEKILAPIRSSSQESINSIVDFINQGDPMIILAYDINTGNSAKDISARGLSVNENRNNTTEIFSRLVSLGKNVGLTRQEVQTVQTDSQPNETESDNFELDISNLGRKYITLGRLLGYYLGLPKAMSMDHDEVQMYFHPANQQAGAFCDINLADVFISTEKYLNAVRSIMTSKNISDLRLEEHFDIIRKILLDDNYEIGYGISEIGTSEEDTKKLTKAQKEVLQKEIETKIKDQNDKLAKIYTDSIDTSSKTLVFNKIDLKIKDESLSYSEDGTIKKMLRIHIYDRLSDPFKNEKQLLKSINNNSLDSVLNSTSAGFIRSLNSNTIFNRFTSIFNKKSSSETKRDNKVIASIKDRFLKFQKIDAKIAREIDTIIKASVPTIELGAENGFFQSISLNNDNGGLANQINMINYVTSLGNAQDYDKTQKRFKTFLNPGSLSVNMLGYPLVSLGQRFYVTGGTNTTLDNIYVVDGVSHAISEGNFITSLTLSSTNDANFDPVNITKSLIELGHVTSSETLNPDIYT